LPEQDAQQAPRLALVGTGSSQQGQADGKKGDA
jgi:hypothetical protein